MKKAEVRSEVHRVGGFVVGFRQGAIGKVWLQWAGMRLKLVDGLENAGECVVGVAVVVGSGGAPGMGSARL